MLLIRDEFQYRHEVCVADCVCFSSSMVNFLLQYVHVGERGVIIAAKVLHTFLPGFWTLSGLDVASRYTFREGCICKGSNHFLLSRYRNGSSSPC